MWILQPVRRRVLSIQESLWIASEQCLWRFGSLPWRLTRVIGRGLGILSSRGIRWRRGLLSWISASPTRRTVVTSIGTGPTNHCLQRVIVFILPFPLLTVGPCEVIVWLHYLLSSLSDHLFWLASQYLPTWSYCLAAISHYAFTSLNTWLRFA